jgi:hypothetical protein
MDWIVEGTRPPKCYGKQEDRQDGWVFPWRKRLAKIAQKLPQNHVEILVLAPTYK